MKPVKLPEGAWVVVCDGHKALVLENVGDADLPNLRTRDVDKQAVPPTSDLGADQPGRVHQSVGPRRSSVEQTDFHAEEEKKFLLDLVGRLETALEKKACKDIVVVAPPRALGTMRPAYSTRLKAAIQAEIDKDMTAMPVYDIERHLTGRSG